MNGKIDSNVEYKEDIFHYLGSVCWEDTILMDIILHFMMKIIKIKYWSMIQMKLF